MKLVSTITFAIMLLATMSVAQDATTGKKGNPADAAASNPQAAAHASAEAKKEVASDATESKETPKLTEADKQGYALGVQLGLDVARQGIAGNPQLLLQGMSDALAGDKFLMSAEDMNTVLTAMQKDQREKMLAALKDAAERNKQSGETFLAANKAKDGVVTLPSGLQYKVLKAADGRKPGVDDKVVCNYRGTLLDGTEIDSSYKRNQPSTFPVKGLIKGWTEALQLMPVGSKWQVFVPSELAYGERGYGRTIGPNTALIFEVELLSIENKAGDQAAPQGSSAKPHGSL